MDPASPPEADVDEEEKPGPFSSLEPHTQRKLVVVGVAVLVVGLLGGFAAGFKVEQNLAETNDANAQSLNAAAQKLTSVAGVVTGKAPDSIEIASSNGFPVQIKPVATYTVKKAVKATLRDIVVGSRILQSGDEVGTANYDAVEIIVLPLDSRFKGLNVTAVDGDKVKAVQANTTPLTVNVKPTTAIYRLDASSTTRIAKGSRVMANGLGAFGRDTFIANEIIILDPGSAFAKR
jgi:hypothetical protein